MSIVIHFALAALIAGFAVMDLSIGSPRAAAWCAFCAGVCFAFGVGACMDRSLRRRP